METSDEDSDAEHRTTHNHFCGLTFNPKMEGFPSTVNILKPQIDKIFSEVQKNLPTIDFDSSDVSSDNDEPIFFHQNLKLSELNSTFDDDKDLDTSLSQGDGPQLTCVNRGDTIFSKNDSFLSCEDINISVDKNSESVTENRFDNVPYEMYDNDLAAIMAQTSYPTDEEIANWRCLARQMEDSELELEIREEIDFQRSRNLGHFSSHSVTSPSMKANKLQSNILESRGDDCREELVDESHNDSSESQEVDIKGTSSFLLKSVTKLKKKLEEGIKKLDMNDKRKNFQETARSKDEEIVSKFSPQEPTLLSLSVFEDIDIDSVLNSANEENISLTNLRAAAQPSVSQTTRSLEGSGDGKGKKALSEELTMIQKLAQLSAQQGGTDAAAVDPQTGAIIKASADTVEDNQGKGNSPVENAALQIEDQIIAGKSLETGSQTSGASTSNFGTNTATRVEKAKILYGRLKHEKRETEPPTIFIDLRGFERKKEAQKQAMQSVQRVLGINNMQEESDSSSDEEMVERCNWRLTRQKIKDDLVAHGAAATLQKDPVGPEKKEVLQQPKYKRPPRVINLQKHEVSCRWNVAPPETQTEEVSTEVLEDNKRRVEKLEAEREKERQREEARKLREQREKEREKRVRMGQQIEAAKSLATTQGRQSAGENTPVLFDLEVSYEPAPTTLPTILSPDRETLLLTVNLSSNGEIIQHRSRSNRSVDTGEGLSGTYTALLSWLLSLVPHNFNFLKPQPQPPTQPPANMQAPTFYVIGLQQLWMQEELKLYIVVTPSEHFLAESGKNARHKKNKGKDETRGSSRFSQHISNHLLTNTLSSVCPWLELLTSVTVQPDRQDGRSSPPHADSSPPGYAYTPPLPKISTKPLSTFIQMNSDPQAARKIFNIPVGFYWQTVDNDEGWCDIECHDENVNYETQNTMSLVYKRIYGNPSGIMSILNRAAQEGLDLAGVRLVYPCGEQMKLQGEDAPPSSDLDNLNQVGPVLALALRGTFARTIWLDSVGPSDPELARRTDPNSLCAQFGGESRENVHLFCPRNLSRVQSELTRWFGGRVPSGAATVDVGLPYLKKEVGKNKKGKKHSSTDHKSLPVHRPPAALTATCRADILLVLSPLLPVSYLGVLMASAQRRGYQLRGVRRLCLSAKVAKNLGVPQNMTPYFCPGARLDDLDVDKPLEAIAPCTVFLLRKENAAHNTASLLEAYMVQLTLGRHLGCVQQRLDEPLVSQHLFHAVMYTDALLALLGGDFAKSPEFDLSHMCRSSSVNLKVEKDQEQVATLILLGHDILKKCGLELAKILNVLPYSSRTPLQAVLSEKFELLGLKWTPSLSMYQAKELTPYEVGDKRWRPSIRSLASEPALVLALRGVNIFTRLRPIVEEQSSSSKSSMANIHSKNKEQPLQCIMSHNMNETEMFARLFFFPSDLYPDPQSRSLLPFLPESKMYFNLREEESENEIRRRFSLKPLDELNLTQEALMEEMVAGQQPITTAMVVKPAAVQKYLPRILKKIVQEKFEIVGLRLAMLGTDTAEAFVPATLRKDTTSRHKCLEAMCCGPALVLALQSPNAIKHLCDLVGPEEPMAARRQSQFLWRGEFGSDLFNNGIYCSGFYVDAIRDLNLLFPDGLCCHYSQLLANEKIPSPACDSVIDTSSNLSRHVVLAQEHHAGVSHDVTIEEVHHLLLQTNCLVLTPPLVKSSSRSKELTGTELLAVFINLGFHLVAARLVWLTQKQAECFLCVRGGGSFQQVNFLSSGPCLVVALQRDNAVLAFDTLLSQSSEALRLMKEYGSLILRPQNLTQSHQLLAFFFDHVMPGSQLTIEEKAPEVRPVHGSRSADGSS